MHNRLKQYNFSKLHLILLALLITANPVLLYRAMHPALCSQWLILASIYLYIKKSNALNSVKLNLNQGFLLFISALIHPYMAFIILGFIFILPAKNYFFDKTLNLKKAILLPLLSGLTVIITWFCIGYLRFSNAIDSQVNGGFGLYSLNLNTLYNSFGYSKFLKNQQLTNPLQYEGYAYLGLGLIIFIIISLVVSISKKTDIKKHYVYFPLFLYCLFVLFFSVTNKITFNENIIFEFDIPESVRKLGNIFRASSRTFWVIYYLLILFSIILFSKLKVKKTIKSIFLIAIVFIQFYDLTKFFNTINFEEGTYKTPLNEERWNVILKKVKHLNTFPPFEFKGLEKPYDYQDLAYLAVKNNLTYTNAYVARTDKKSEEKITDSIVNELVKKVINKSDIFITNKLNLDKLKNSIITHNANLSYLDGLYLIYSNKIAPIKQTEEEIEILKIAKKELKKNNFKIFKQTINNYNVIKSNIENITTTPNYIRIGGWAFIKNKKSNINDSIFLMLKSKNNTYFKNIKTTSRKDITKHFKANNLDNSGFNSIHYLNSIEKGNYSIGIAIRESNKKWSYQDINKIIKIGYNIIPQPIEYTTIYEKNSIKFNLESLVLKKKTVLAKGWAFIEKTDSKNAKISLILRSNKEQFKIETNNFSRPDVTQYFKSNISYHNSGFETQFNIKDLPNGEYSIGILIENKSLNINEILITDKKMHIIND
ncbi:MAG: DUF6311 domain-containing protein [Polaribacter sp.]|uniref:DUF6311 domain-containing protein n=1 Tax=Polaribacter sp. TaxID=1920175 RepID=UPI002F35BEF2